MSDRSEYVEIYDLKSKINRRVTRAAYKIIGPRRYQLLNEDVPAPQATTQKKSVEAAALAEDNPPNSIESSSVTGTTSEPVNLNTTIETPQEGVTVIRRKPGPKPKQKVNG